MINILTQGQDYEHIENQELQQLLTMAKIELNPGLISSLSFMPFLIFSVIFTEPLFYARPCSTYWGYSSEQDRQNDSLSSGSFHLVLRDKIIKYQARQVVKSVTGENQAGKEGRIRNWMRA